MSATIKFDPGEIFALNLTIVKPEKLDYRTLLDLVQAYRTASKGRFPDFVEFTADSMARFLRDIGGEGHDGDEFLGIKCLVDPDRIESHSVHQPQ